MLAGEVDSQRAAQTTSPSSNDSIVVAISRVRSLEAANGVRRGFLNGDPLLDFVVQAENAMHALSVEVYYLCVGKPVAAKHDE
jgi:hypothetical protein